MDVRLFEYIVTIAQEGSISAASEVIHITQSALSQSLIKLEQQLGTPIFERSGKKMIPTDAGKMYLEGAKTCIQIKNDTYEKIEQLKHGRENSVSLAICPQVYQHTGAQLVQLLHDRFGSSAVSIQELGSDAAVEYLDHDFIDGAIIRYDGKPNSSLSVFHLYDEEFMLAVPNSMAWDGTGIDPKALQKCPFAVINSDYRKFGNLLFQDRAFNASISFRVDNIQSIRTLVENGYAAAFVPWHYAIGLRNCKLYHWHTRPKHQVVFAVSKYSAKREQLNAIYQLLKETLSVEP